MQPQLEKNKIKITPPIHIQNGHDDQNFIISRFDSLVSNLKIAIVHDWLITKGGAEIVLGQLIKLFPSADIFSILDKLPSTQRDFLNGKNPKTTILNSIPGVKHFYRTLLPLMPLTIEQINLSGYDLVISSSYAVAKGVLTGPNQIHICYCHSPMRYAWDMQEQYLNSSRNLFFPITFFKRIILHYLRIWDVRSAYGVNKFISNSKFISKRILKTYNRESTVIYPPINIDNFPFKDNKSDFYVTASRLVSYKKIDAIVSAFVKMPNKKLIVIGDGPERSKLQSIAKHSTNISIIGYASFSTLLEHISNAKAFVFAAEEDFGIAPLEAQACGTPVIAYGKGGSLETILPGRTGIFFTSQSADSIIDAIEEFEKNISAYIPMSCRRNALRFSSDKFDLKIKQLVVSQFDLQLDSSNFSTPELTLESDLELEQGINTLLS